VEEIERAVSCKTQLSLLPEDGLKGKLIQSKLSKIGGVKLHLFRSLVEDKKEQKERDDDLDNEKEKGAERGRLSDQRTAVNASSRVI